MKPFFVSLLIVAGLLVIGAAYLIITAGGDVRAAFGFEERAMREWKAENPVTSITVDTTDDNVVFRASDDGSVSVTCYESKTHLFDITQDGGALKIICAKRWLPSFRVGRNYTMTITMPAKDMELLNVSVASGAIELDMSVRVGSLTAHTTSGHITLAGFTAETLNAGATSGNITVRNAGAVTGTLRATSGNILLSGATFDSLKTNATSGASRLENCTIRELDMHTTSGGITCTGLDAGSADLNVTSGNVDLGLAVADPAVYRLELASISGKITVSGGGYETSGSRNLSLGTGGQLIKVGVTSGNITVRFT
jgi:lia operon protein LiaG